MAQTDISRREFIGTAAAASASLAAGASFLRPYSLLAAESDDPAQTVSGTGEQIQFGIVGVGMQGSGLLANAIELPGVKCAAACDLYDERHVLAREITGNPNLQVTRRYHDLLENKDIRCIVAAVPDHWHRQIVVDALAAGKDIYCEKPMSHSAADGEAMVEAARHSDCIVQIGSQRVSSQICAKAKQLIAEGVLGDIVLIEGWLGRNDPTGAWVYPPPPGLSTENLDWDTWLGEAPKIPFDPYVFARWRCWRQYGTGVAGDLLVHLISGMMFMLGINEPPKQAMSAGGILRWKDGRNMPDVHSTVFYYGVLPVYMRLNLSTEMPETYRFQGSKGILEVGEFGLSYTPQSGVDTAPSYYDASFPRAMRNAYEKQWHEAHDPQIGHEPMPEALSFRGPDYDDVKPHLLTFFDSVRTRKPLVEDAVFGHHAALACHMANESYFRKTAVYWDANTRTIKS